MHQGSTSLQAPANTYLGLRQIKRVQPETRSTAIPNTAKMLSLRVTCCGVLSGMTALVLEMGVSFGAEGSDVPDADTIGATGINDINGGTALDASMLPLTKSSHFTSIGKSTPGF